MEKINCPLCHSVGAITYSDSEIKTIVTPVHVPRGEMHVGNYKRLPNGGRYDWSHADVCPKLTKAFSKTSLLQSYVFNPKAWESDNNSFEDYENAFNLLGIGIHIQTLRNREKRSWYQCCFLFSKIVASDGQYNKAYGDTPEKAFLLLKHRLLCGELIWVLSSSLQKLPQEKVEFRIV